LIRNPKKGNKGINQTKSVIPSPQPALDNKKFVCHLKRLNRQSFSPFHQIDVVYVDSASQSERGNSDGKAHSNFSRSYNHNEQNEYLSLDRTQVAGEGYKRQVDGVQHQFQGHENDDQIPPKHHSDDSQREEDRGQKQIML
jgi:hypothetical protein